MSYKNNGSVDCGYTTSLDDKGKGQVRVSNGTSFAVEHALPGDTVRIVAPRTRRKRRSKSAQLERVLTSPWQRIAPFCSHYGLCGGCSLQHLSYSEQLKLKQDTVSRLIAPHTQEAVKEDNIVPAPNTVYYRNRVDYTFGAARWLEKHEAMLDSDADRRGAGFHVKGFYDKVVHLDHCFLHPSNALRKTVHNWAREHALPYYNSRTHEGVLRLMTVRTSRIHQTMVVLQFAQDGQHVNALCRDLVSTHPEVNSLYYVINSSCNDTAPNMNYTLIHGSPTIDEVCGDLRLKLYPQVFYQTNSQQAEHLYETIASYADVRNDDTVLDLYCGIGSIGLFLARKARHVVGVDIVPKSIEAARENALYNGIKNADFFALASENAILSMNKGCQTHNCENAKHSILTEALEKAHCIIVDPPRAGLHKRVITYLCNLNPKVLVYASCNPTTLSRDLQLLSSHYYIAAWRAVDMFPHTYHVETVVKLVPK